MTRTWSQEEESLLLSVWEKQIKKLRNKRIKKSELYRVYVYAYIQSELSRHFFAHTKEINDKIDDVILKNRIQLAKQQNKTLITAYNKELNRIQQLTEQQQQIAINTSEVNNVNTMENSIDCVDIESDINAYHIISYIKQNPASTINSESLASSSEASSSNVVEIISVDTDESCHTNINEQEQQQDNIHTAIQIDNEQIVDLVCDDESVGVRNTTPPPVENLPSHFETTIRTDFQTAPTNFPINCEPNIYSTIYQQPAVVNEALLDAAQQNLQTVPIAPMSPIYDLSNTNATETSNQHTTNTSNANGTTYFSGGEGEMSAVLQRIESMDNKIAKFAKRQSHLIRQNYLEGLQHTILLSKIYKQQQETIKVLTTFLKQRNRIN